MNCYFTSFTLKNVLKSSWTNQEAFPKNNSDVWLSGHILENGPSRGFFSTFISIKSEN